MVAGLLAFTFFFSLINAPLAAAFTSGAAILVLVFEHV